MADTRLSDLSAASALAASDLFYVVQSAGSGGAKATGTQLLTLVGTTYLPLAGGTMTGLLTITQATANASVLASTGYSLTGSDATPMVNLAGTWNTSGTPTLIKANVTDTASNAASLLMDLQVGGVSRVRANKTGNVVAVGTRSAEVAPALEAANWTAGTGWTVGSGTASKTAGSGSYLTVTSGSATSGAWYRVEFTVSSWTAGSTTPYIGGANGSAAKAAGTYVEYLKSEGTATLRFAASSDAALTISYVSCVQITDGTGTAAFDGVVTAPMLDARQVRVALGTLTNPSIVWRSTGSAGDYVGLYAASNDSIALARNGSALVTWGASGATHAGYVQAGSTQYLGISTDALIYRDAAATLAQRNSTNAQTYRLYGTYTDASNYERLTLKTTAGSSVELAAETAGTGGDNLDVKLTPAGTGGVVIGSYQQFTEMTAPAAGASNTVRIYAEDNGSGKTRLMAIFPTGAAQQIAIEP